MWLVNKETDTAESISISVESSEPPDIHFVLHPFIRSLFTHTHTKSHILYFVLITLLVHPGALSANSAQSTIHAASPEILNLSLSLTHTVFCQEM